MMRLRLSELLQKNKWTCWRFKLEIKTGEFVFLRKHRDNLKFVYLLSLAFSVLSIGTLIRKPTCNLPEENIESRRNNRSPAAS